MPFTPFHFGIHGSLGLALKKWLDLPVLALANVVIDFEPLVVMLTRTDYPLHGYAHTLLFGALLGGLWGILAYYALRPAFGYLMRLFRLSYTPALKAMIISGVLGIWLHVLTDSFMHRDIKPFWPSSANPFADVVNISGLYTICNYFILAAFIIYCAILLVPAFFAKKSSE